jgi:hypothetical protein
MPVPFDAPRPQQLASSTSIAEFGLAEGYVIHAAGPAILPAQGPAPMRPGIWKARRPILRSQVGQSTPAQTPPEFGRGVYCVAVERETPFRGIDGSVVHLIGPTIPLASGPAPMRNDGVWKAWRPIVTSTPGQSTPAQTPTFLAPKRPIAFQTDPVALEPPLPILHHLLPVVQAVGPPPPPDTSRITIVIQSEAQRPDPGTVFADVGQPIAIPRFSSPPKPVNFQTDPVSLEPPLSILHHPLPPINIVGPPPPPDTSRTSITIQSEAPRPDPGLAFADVGQPIAIAPVSLPLAPALARESPPAYQGPEFAGSRLNYGSLGLPPINTQTAHPWLAQAEEPTPFAGSITTGHGQPVAIPPFSRPFVAALVASAEPPRPEPGAASARAGRFVTQPFVWPPRPYLAAAEPPRPDPGMSRATAARVSWRFTPPVIVQAEAPRLDLGSVQAQVNVTHFDLRRYPIPATIASNEVLYLDQGGLFSQHHIGFTDPARPIPATIAAAEASTPDPGAALKGYPAPVLPLPRTTIAWTIAISTAEAPRPGEGSVTLGVRPPIQPLPATPRPITFQTDPVVLEPPLPILHHLLPPIQIIPPPPAPVHAWPSWLTIQSEDRRPESGQVTSWSKLKVVFDLHWPTTIAVAEPPPAEQGRSWTQIARATTAPLVKTSRPTITGSDVEKVIFQTEWGRWIYGVQILVPTPLPITYDGVDILVAIETWWNAVASTQGLTADGKIWYLEAPENVAATLPYAVWFLVSDVPETWTTSYAFERVSVQFNFHAATPWAARQLGRQFRQLAKYAPLTVNGVPVAHVLPDGSTLTQGEDLGPGGRDCWIAGEVLDIALTQ